MNDDDVIDMPPGDSPTDNAEPSSDGIVIGEIRRTGKKIALEDVAEMAASGLRRHNYYNRKNAEAFIELVEKWHATHYEDCYLPASALGLSPDSLRVKLNCARAFVVDNMKSLDDIWDIARRCEIRLTNLGVVMRLSAKLGKLDFADVMKPGDGPVDPIAEAMKFLESKPRGGALFTLKELNLSPAQQEWFKQTLAQVKGEFAGDYNRNQVVIVKLM